MKKVVTLFLSALLLSSTLISCASDPNTSHTKEGTEIGLGAGAGTGAVMDHNEENEAVSP